jgi:hypothetical protein
MNLTDTGVLVKKALKIFLLIITVYYVVLLVVEPGIRDFFKKIADRRIPANPVYGQLDPLEFVVKPTTGEKSTYVLSTKNGRLPTNIPEKVSVYRFKDKTFSYLAGKNAVDQAKILGFEESDLITDLKGSTYKWRSIKTGGTLEIQIETGELKLLTNLIGRGTDFSKGTINQDSAKKFAREKLLSINRFDDGYYPSGSSIAYLGTFSPAGLVETNTQVEAQIARVDFFRNLDNYPVLGPDPKKGLLHIYIRSPFEYTPLNNPIAETYFWTINPDSRAIYPIISVGEAWKAVTEDKGVTANITPKGASPFQPYTPTKVDSILIDNIFLAYYDTPKPQKFLQPIYVFEGKYNTKGTEGGYITIYFPAITREYTKQIDNTQQ